MSTLANDIAIDYLKDWLEDYGVTGDDILYDENGDGYIMVETENGTVGEDGYDVYFKKVYIPRPYQSLLS